jgi:hypothetical protein
MSFFPAKAPVYGTCPYCNLLVRVPPGVYYEGEPHHRQCAAILAEQDYTDRVALPWYESVEQALQEALDVDTSSSPFDL